MAIRYALYTVLNVSHDAEQEVIEAAYRALMKKYHPDRSSDGAISAARATEINQAYTILRDPTQRAAYDRDERTREAGPIAAPPARRESGPPPPDARSIYASRPANEQPRAAVKTMGARSSWWLIAVFILICGGAAVGMQATRDRIPELGADVPLVARSGTQAQQSPEGDDPTPDTPISKQRIRDAVAEFKRIDAKSGLNGASQYSENCFELQSRTASLDDFDFCVAFDYAASAAVGIEADPFGVETVPRFRSQNLTIRHIGAARQFARDAEWAEDRLGTIRKLTNAALSARYVSAIPTPIPEIAPAPEPPLPITVAPSFQQRRAVPPPQLRRKRAAPQQQQRQQRRPARDHDFLESHDFIY
jgi:curved DNA-binding protein CbpA